MSGPNPNQNISYMAPLNSNVGMRIPLLNYFWKGIIFAKFEKNSIVRSECVLNT